MTITTSKLTRAAGLAAAVAGLLYIVIQFIHPAEELATVTGRPWAITGAMTIAFAVLALVGVTGIYLRQVEQAGVLGLVGYLIFGSFFLIPIAFTFAEVLIMPQLVDDAPEYVEGFLAIFSGAASDVDMGALGAIGLVSFALYVLGSAVFGSALLRARVLPRWAATTMVVAAGATPLTAVLPHALGRYAAVPMGVALIGLGAALWTERRDIGAVATPRSTRSAPGRAAAE